MSRLTLTPGMESRLDGAPETELEAQDLEAAAAYFQTQGMDYEEALQAAMQHLASRKQAAAAREAGLAQASQQRQAAWDMAGTDQRPTDVMEAEADYERGLAAEMAGGYRQDGPILRPGTEAFAARDRMMALQELPFSMGLSEDPVNNELTIRQNFEERFGRPARTEADMQLARDLMVRDYQTDFGNRNVAQAPGRWGSQQPFESQQQMDAYEASSPGQPSQLEQDMMASDTPMILENKPGGAGPQIAAPGPGIANEAFGQPARRPDLEARGYVPTAVQGPSGEQYAYKLSPEAQAEATRKRDAFLYEQRTDRLARRSGRSYQDVDEKLPLPEELQGGDDMAMRQLKRDARRGYEDRKAAQVANARRIQTANAQMNSGQLGLQMQNMDPEYRQVMLLDRLTQGRRGGATPLDVQAQNMQNAMPAIRSALAGAIQSMDPQARSLQEMQTRMAILNSPPEQQVAFSRLKGERMGEGYSAAPVGKEWTSAMRGRSLLSREGRLRSFRDKMETWGYSAAEIDEYIDSRMNAAEGMPSPQENAEYPQPEPGSPVLPSPTQPPPGRVWTPFGGMRR